MYIVCTGAVMFQLPGITSAMLSIPVINQSINQSIKKYSRFKSIYNDRVFLIISGNLFHSKTVCGKKEYLYTSVPAYDTNKFLSCDDLVAVANGYGAGAGMS